MATHNDFILDARIQVQFYRNMWPKFYTKYDENQCFNHFSIIFINFIKSILLRPLHHNDSSIYSMIVYKKKSLIDKCSLTLSKILIEMKCEWNILINAMKEITAQK